MKRIDLFKKHLEEKKAVKIIAGIDNFDLDNVKKVVIAAQMANGSAVDVSADKDVIEIAKANTQLPIFVSSIDASLLSQAMEWGADAIEIGNYDALYKKGERISAEQILDIVSKTLALVEEDTFISVTVPAHIEISEQIELAKKLEELNINLIQTEGAATTRVNSDGARGLLETALASISNTMELARNVKTPVMCASGITPATAALAFAAGASAIGVGSCINKLDSQISMIATAKLVVEAVNKMSAAQMLNV